jgi:protein-disulfide isomerase
MQKDYFLPVSVLIAGVLIAGAVIYTNGLKSGNKAVVADNTNQTPSVPVSLGLTSEDVILGDPNAPITLIEYGDFQCPFCGRFFSQTENLIKEQYVRTGKVKFVYRHFAFLGPESIEAAKAAECAKDQGKFWEFHDALFNAEIQDGQEHNGNLNTALFKSLANQLGMNAISFSACLASDKYANKVQKDYDSGLAAGVRATPTSFVNGQRVEGAVPFSNFKNIIDNFLAN